eukprot:Gregarina_sp_Poly_1__2008@NODE_1527_length_3924_cov_82_479907_g1010_i0_p1_GENE_NODE_1527_length_3924_cov_82_479907_g1010_i0NODE_1527_length_3924_cov_82_479907_g1010_i0_p1_ORF_typecomplete_len340_score66_65Glutaredoxin/PF00462_24/5_4e03Glutaredoxin/PF00462_24/5e19Thioredoxin/PF00085_20/0_00056Thioredoxin/PF00085_20/5e03Thioredoxin/PF00085_20/2_4e02SH3BGR/PF04908_15/1_2e04SH3BGR/PF04908_15/0_021Thioredoxin_6/PF13848_6/1_9Thioredoxin_6/PF13848_6/42Thioredoxin_14/PF18402_1/0_081Thioredoxin_13/PF1840
MQELKSHFQIKAFADEEPNIPKVLLFAGTNHPQSNQMWMISETLSKKFAAQVRFAFCDVGRLVSSRKPLQINAIPLVWILKNSEVADVVAGADAQALTEKVMSLVNGSFIPVANNYNLKRMLATAIEAAEMRADEILAEKLVIAAGPLEVASELCQKWTLNHGLNQVFTLPLSKMDHNEIDEELSEAFVKKYNLDPQSLVLFINGEQVPGDKLDHDFEVDWLPKIVALNTEMNSRLNTRMKELINKSEVMLFMKGTKAAPFCKFSKEIVRIFNEAEIDFDYFNIFEDDVIREGLKKYSNWPTYPQVYVRGELIGGLDIIKQMMAESNGVAGLRDALLQV